MLCLWTSTQAVDLFCSIDDINYFSTVCEVMSLTDSKAIENTGRDPSDAASLKIVYFVGLDFIPTNLGKIFPLLTDLHLSGNQIEKLTVEDMKQLPHLEVLSVYYNRLKSLDGDLFKYNLNLKFIDFSDNQIQHIGTGLLDNLKNLTRVYFNRNSCINTYAQSRAAVVELSKTLSCLCPPIPDYCS